jgi:hypothetical protein
MNRQISWERRMPLNCLLVFYCLALSSTMLTACAAKPIVANSAVLENAPTISAIPHAEAAPVNASSRSSSAKMPKPLLGVWHENTEEGRRQCERYRYLGQQRGPIDEAPDPLVGAVVITDQMVHTYAEYGEGDFFSIQDVKRLSRGEWRVRSFVYIDTMPADDEIGAESIDRFSLQNGTLHLTADVQDKRTQTEMLFRCGSVHHDPAN